MAAAQLFTISNVPLAATPPGYFVSNSNGAAVPAGHTSWSLVFDTTGLPSAQLLADIVVQSHYTGVQLGVTGLSNQGQVTNTDGTVTQITGGPFTGWIDDCGSGLLQTSYVDLRGVTHHNPGFGCDLGRILGAYPDRSRFLVKSCPGYASVPSVTLSLT